MKPFLRFLWKLFLFAIPFAAIALGLFLFAKSNHYKALADDVYWPNDDQYEKYNELSVVFFVTGGFMIGAGVITLLVKVMILMANIYYAINDYLYLEEEYECPNPSCPHEADVTCPDPNCPYENES